MVEWLTHDWGWITTVQRGARKIGKKSPVRPMAFHLLSLQLVGRGTLKSATQIEPLAPPSLLTGHALAAGFYLNELLMRALQREVAVPGLFHAYAHSVPALAAPDAAMGQVIRQFEYQLLDELGVAIDWHHTADLGAQIEPNALYGIDAERGILQNRAGRLAAPGRVLRAIAADLPLESAMDRRCARDVMQYLLRPHVGTAVFHSRALWQSNNVTEDS